MIQVLTTGDLATDPTVPAREGSAHRGRFERPRLGRHQRHRQVRRARRRRHPVERTRPITGAPLSYPRFLTYQGGVNGAAMTANDFACISALGTEGCGFEQQLESVLKALWPKVDPMPEVPGKNRITFLGDPNGFGQDGQGDGANAGFLRNDRGRSLIAVILVSDEEDCSSARHEALHPDALPRSGRSAGDAGPQPALPFQSRRTSTPSSAT